MQIFEMFGASFIFVTFLMIACWGIGAIRNNAGIVDIGWALGFFISMLAYFLIGDGFIMKRLLLFIMVSLWSLRLAWHLWKRFDFSKEDPRYTVIREKMGPELSAFKLLLLFLFQGFLVIILTIPFVVVAANGTSYWHSIEGIGFLVWLGGFTGQYFADRQLEKFKSNPDNKDKVCRKGLWRFSRHPNYFFEFVIWLGYCLFAWPSPGGSLALISPLIMLFLLTRVSGIPPAEEQALKSKGDAYRKYQEKTSVFVPLPPKEN